jgi:hypothetical protein
MYFFNTIVFSYSCKNKFTTKVFFFNSNIVHLIKTTIKKVQKNYIDLK